MSAVNEKSICSDFYKKDFYKKDFCRKYTLNSNLLIIRSVLI